ncbi:hypothetical protein BX661DRAFT_183304 [Kickxella alabastrina]|uniref:uncharacterized protein n=1 Tax=Kickxella alabastrina TaxID=61397 RepID=UPI00222018EB|nr:uncharacterized protein BX661DRAFT_183304 [Kickxella alabastrina]KAI7826707.1 hypothetical protein BX661DRAFT_183304 [Kickxella alabastrina]
MRFYHIKYDKKRIEKGEEVKINSINFIKYKYFFIDKHITDSDVYTFLKTVTCKNKKGKQIIDNTTFDEKWKIKYRKQGKRYSDKLENPRITANFFIGKASEAWESNASNEYVELKNNTTKNNFYNADKNMGINVNVNGPDGKPEYKLLFVTDKYAYLESLTDLIFVSK